MALIGRTCYFIFLTCFQTSTVKSTHVLRLFGDLFNGTTSYNKHLPAKKPTEVGMRVQLEDILEFDDLKETLTTRVRIHSWWKDNRLDWDEDNYSGTSSIFVPQDLVWRPDIALLNGVKVIPRLGPQDDLVRLTHLEEQILWSPVGVFETKCHVDLEFYPFDSQKCEVKIGTHSSTGGYVELDSMDCMEVSGLGSGTWTLDGVHQYMSERAPHDKNVFKQDVLTCVYTLRRKHGVYVLVLLLPFLLIGLMNMFAFVIPNVNRERVTFAVILLLAFAVYQVILLEKMPMISDKITHLHLYMVCQLCVNVFTLAAVAIQTRFKNGSLRSSSTDDPDPEIYSTENKRKNSLQSISKVSPFPEAFAEEIEKKGKRIWRFAILRQLRRLMRMDVISFCSLLIIQVACHAWFYSVVLATAHGNRKWRGCDHICAGDKEVTTFHVCSSYCR